VLAAGTFLSRVTGFIRVLTVLALLGSSGVADAYNLANTVPNIIYELILGGVLSATMIPVFVEQFRREDRRAGARSISAVLTMITLVLVVVTAALYLFAPAIIHFYLAFNHQGTGVQERAVGTSLLRLFAPQVFFLGAIVVTTALLNARRHFAAAAFSPVANNLISIAAIVATKAVASSVDIGPFRHDHSAILVLGVGTTLGYAVQFLIHLPALARAGISFRPVWDLHDPAVRQITRLSTWLVGVVLANQVSLTIVIILAAQVPGSYTIYNSAYTFFQLPYALFAVSVASVLTPDLAERWSRRDRLGFQRRMIAGTRVTLAVLIPAGIGYALVAGPVILLAARHGATSLRSGDLIGSCLAIFALGLPGYSAFLLLMRGLQAMQDAKAMFVVYVAENALSVVLAFALYPSLGVRGLCLAWVAPYTVCAFAVAAQLRRRVGSLGGIYTIRALYRIALATTVMAAAVYAIDRVLPHGHGDVDLVVRLVVEVTVGAVVYIGAARVLGIRELEPLLALAGRLVGRATSRRPPPPPPGRPSRPGPSGPPSRPAPSYTPAHRAGAR
jgi:putative peptidoglycan lipid II flippase